MQNLILELYLDGERPLVLIDGIGVVAGCAGRLEASKEEEWRKMVMDLGVFGRKKNDFALGLSAGLHE